MTDDGENFAKCGTSHTGGSHHAWGIRKRQFPEVLRHITVTHRNEVLIFFCL